MELKEILDFAMRKGMIIYLIYFNLFILIAKFLM